MFNMSRRDVVVAAGFAAALGLNSRLAIVGSARAQPAPDTGKGFYKYKIGSVEVTALYDGIWKKPHDPAFIKNANIDETKDALAKAGMTTDYVPIPLTVVVLKVGDKLVMIDSGSGAGQWQPTAVSLPDNLKGAGIDPEKISTVLISHFHPDHIFGLMQKGTNAPNYPNAELIVSATEYKWWTEAGRVRKTAGGAQAAGRAHSGRFPDLEKFPADRRREGSRARHSHGERTRTHAGSFGLPAGLGQPAADDLQRRRVCACAARAASGMAGRL